MPYKEICIAMGLIALSMGISNFFGVSGKLGWEEMVKHISRFFLFFFATLYFFHHGKIRLSFIAYSLFVVFFVHAFYGLGQYFWEVSFWSSTVGKFGERLSGVTYNPNKYGFIMALSMVFSFATGIQIKKIAPRIPYRICRALLMFLWVVSFWCLLQSGSRGSWLAAAAGMILVAFLVPQYLKHKTPWVFAFVMFGLLLFLFEANPVFQDRMKALLAGDSSLRLEIWQDCLHYIAKRPLLGYGLGGYEFLERVRPEIYSPHNIILSVFIETGLVGFLAWFYFFFVCIGRLVLPEYRQSSTAVFAGFLLAFFVAGQFDHTLITDKVFLSCLYFSLALVFVGKAGEGFVQYQSALKEVPGSNSVLVIEPNDVHGEVILGYVEYFIRLGYFVDLVVTPGQMREKPFSLNHLQNVRFYAIDEIFLSSLLALDRVRYYSLVFFTSVKAMGRSVTHYVGPEIYTKVFAVLHSREHLADKKIKRLYQAKRLVVLRNFSRDPFLFEVNPHTFGHLLIGSRNRDTRFICVGSFEPALRNTALLIETVQEMVRSGISDFIVTVVTRKKPGEKIPERILPFIELKIGLDYEAMYHEMEKADFFLPLLDSSIPSQREYLSERSTGSIQLIMGFRCPAVIEKAFAGVYELDASNSVLYEGGNLQGAMLEAMEISGDRYLGMRQSLADLSERKKESGLENLRQLLLEHHIVLPVTCS